MLQFFKGLKDYFRGHQMMRSEKWGKWLLLPGLIALLLFFGLMIGVFSWMTPEAWLPIWLHDYFGTAIKGVSAFVLSILGYWAFQPMIMMLLSPLFSHLAEQIEHKLYGISPNPFKVSQVIVDFWRSLLMAMMIFLVMIFLFVLFWLMSWIPMIGFIFASVFIPMMQMYFAGMGFADPAMERRHLTLRQRWSFCWKHRFRILGLGCGFIVLSMIPVLGWFLAPGYALFASSIGVTELLHEDSRY